MKWRSVAKKESENNDRKHQRISAVSWRRNRSSNGSSMAAATWRHGSVYNSVWQPPAAVGGGGGSAAYGVRLAGGRDHRAYYCLPASRPTTAYHTYLPVWRGDNDNEKIKQAAAIISASAAWHQYQRQQWQWRNGARNSMYQAQRNNVAYRHGKQQAYVA